MRTFQTLLFASLLLTTCQDWNYERVSFLEISTEEATEVTANMAVLAGVIRGLREGATVSQHGHVWSAATNTPTLEDNEGSTLLGREGNRSFSSNVGNLRANTLYYFRAYAIFNEQVEYGPVNSFRTENFSLFTESINSNIVEGTCALIAWNLNGYIGTPERFGVVWSATDAMPVIDGEGVMQTERSTPFFNCQTTCPITDELCSLEPKTNYYARPYLVPGNGQAPVYGEVVHFHTFPEPVGWTRLRDFPAEGFLENIAIAANGKGYIGSGETVESRPQDKLWAYDPVSDSWTDRGRIPSFELNGLDLPIVNNSSASFTLNGKIYFGPRFFNNANYQQRWVYDPEQAEAWQQLQDFPQDVTYSGAPVSSFAVGERGYIILNKGDGQGVVWEVSSPGQTEQLSPIYTFSEPSVSNVSAWPNLVAGGKGYLLLSNKQLWVFDPDAITGTSFFQMDSFPEYQPIIAFAAKERLYAGLGYLDSEGEIPTPHFWEFDPQRPAGQQWQRMPDFPGDLVEFRSAFAIDDAGYLVFAGDIDPSTGTPVFASKEVWRLRVE